MDPWGSVQPQKQQDNGRSNSRPFESKISNMNLAKKDPAMASNPFGRQDDEHFFSKGDKNNTTSTTMAYTGELKADDGF